MREGSRSDVISVSSLNIGRSQLHGRQGDETILNDDDDSASVSALTTNVVDLTPRDGAQQSAQVCFCSGSNARTLRLGHCRRGGALVAHLAATCRHMYERANDQRYVGQSVAGVQSLSTFCTLHPNTTGASKSITRREHSTASALAPQTSHAIARRECRR